VYINCKEELFCGELVSYGGGNRNGNGGDKNGRRRRVENEYNQGLESNFSVRIKFQRQNQILAVAKFSKLSFRNGGGSNNRTVKTESEEVAVRCTH
jgi:hypothetical protein